MFKKAGPYLIAAPAVALGVALFALSLLAQYRRLALYLHQGLGFADPACTTGYCDSMMFWLAGHFARAGMTATLYDPARFTAAAAAILPYKTGYWPFVYPPTMLLPASLLSLFPLAAGYYGFCLLTTGLSIWLLRGAGIPRWCIGLGLCSLAALWNLYLGQFGLLCGALLLAGLAGMRTRPLSAGMLLALLCIKPQYALLVPVAVLAARRWRTLIAGVASLAVLLAATLVFGGTSIWAAYLGAGRAGMAALLTQRAGFQSMGISVFWMVRGLGASLAAATMFQAFAAALCAAAMWQLWRRPGPPPLIPTFCLALLATPYGFTDDLAVYGVLLPCLARRDAPWRNALLAWLWVAPAFMPRFAAVFGFSPGPLLLLAALWLSRPPGFSSETMRLRGPVRA